MATPRMPKLSTQLSYLANETEAYAELRKRYSGQDIALLVRAAEVGWQFGLVMKALKRVLPPLLKESGPVDWKKAKAKIATPIEDVDGMPELPGLRDLQELGSVGAAFLQGYDELLGSALFRHLSKLHKHFVDKEFKKQLRSLTSEKQVIVAFTLQVAAARGLPPPSGREMAAIKLLVGVEPNNRDYVVDPVKAERVADAQRKLIAKMRKRSLAGVKPANQAQPATAVREERKRR